MQAALTGTLVLSIVACCATLRAQSFSAVGFRPEIIKTWDDAAITTLEIPLADPVGSPKHISADYYYKIPVRPIFKSYPISAPSREPSGYMERLKQQEPEVVWDDSTHRPSLSTMSDWLKAGQLAFESPFFYEQLVSLDEARDPNWYDLVHPPLTRDGIMPFSRYVIRKRGEVEVRSFGCSTCHTHVMSGGSGVKGAQGNFGVEQAEAYRFCHRMPAKSVHAIMHGLFAVPWLKSGGPLQARPDERGGGRAVLRCHSSGRYRSRPY